MSYLHINVHGGEGRDCISLHTYLHIKYLDGVVNAFSVTAIEKKAFFIKSHYVTFYWDMINTSQNFLLSTLIVWSSVFSFKQEETCVSSVL